jgi:hypothetical protein
MISTQSVNTDVTRRILGCQNTLVQAANLLQYLDAVALAPYFSTLMYTNSSNLVLEKIDDLMDN